MARIYLHGLGQTPDSWKKTIERVNDDGKSLCPDLAKLLRGKKACYEVLYGAFTEICEGQEEKLDLCGLSLGSVLALHYAIAHPEKVNSLVLIAPQYKMPMTLLKFQNFLFYFMPKSSFRQTGFGKREFMELCKSMMALDFSQRIRSVRCPTLVLCGEKDSANRKAAVALTAALEKGRLEVIPGAGHEVNVDAPEKLAEVLSDFYQSVAGCMNKRM